MGKNKSSPAIPQVKAASAASFSLNHQDEAADEELLDRNA